MLQHIANWRHPLDVLANLPEDIGDFALLYSGMQLPFSGRYSLLAVDVAERVTAEDFTSLASRLTSGNAWEEHLWLGYIGYPLRHAVEDVPRDANSPIITPPLWFHRYRCLFRFDHIAQSVEVFAESQAILDTYLPLLEEKAAVSSASAPVIADLQSNMSREAYLAHVSTLIEAIRNGDLYQANLTRKFMGSIVSYDAKAIFRDLCTISPAPYSTFLKHGDLHILSSSPERFLHIDAEGRVDARPIKGSAARSAHAQEDAQHKAQLQESTKDKAENLMIVDLMRNDLARHCVPGSVKVDSLYDITSYETIHHMSSTITGQKRADCSTLDLVAGCFPPGSMTGTPKVKAMEYCSKLEQMERGIYSGAIGWFGGDGSADLSVVIRTLILQGGQFEFQVGGAIVYDSQAESEWRETITKALAIAKSLGIPIKTLEEL